jgi:hypothetical protein
MTVAAISVASREALMGTKDKGGRNVKKTAVKDLKQKRLDRKAKKTAAAARPSDRAFGR